MPFTIFNFSLFNNKVIDKFTEKKCSRLILQKMAKKRKKIHYIIFKIKKHMYLCTGRTILMKLNDPTDCRDIKELPPTIAMETEIV